MNIYSLIKRFNHLKSSRLKLFAIYAMHITGRRYLGVFFDPVLGCNLRCKMCYFSDDEKRKEFKGVINEEQLTEISRIFFPRALKLQIGCGTEPTLYKGVAKVIELAKSKSVPYISITTNANLLDEAMIEEYLESGLDEFTLSMHGVTKETYEGLMTNANYEKFASVLELLSKAKNRFDFKIRVNYTMNEDNVEELASLFEIFGHVKFDVIQLRPISKLGNTAYNNYSHQRIIDNYDSVLLKVKEEANKRDIICILPSKKQMLNQYASTDNSLILESTYCYVSPKYYWKQDWNIGEDSFESYSKRKKIAKKLFSNVFYNKKTIERRDKKHFSYEID